MINFSILFRASNHKIVDKKKIVLNFLLKLSDLKSDFTLTTGYLNLALNNPAQDSMTIAYSSRGKHLVRTPRTEFTVATSQ